MLLRTIVFVYVLFAGFVYFFRTIYVTELAVSFVPFIAAVAIFFVVLYFLFVFLNKKKKVLWIDWVNLLLGFVISFLFSVMYLQTYWTHKEPVVIQDGVKVLYANLYWQNTEYEDIKHMVETYDPDVLMFVEFADHHWQHLGDFLGEKYAYVNRATWSQDLMVGSMVFSKYPVNNIWEDFEQWAWRYGYFELDYGDRSQYIYLVHTSSPISEWYWEMRNRQLDTLVHDFTEHEPYRTHDGVIMLGDFNVSPWSAHYASFVDGLWTGMYNATLMWAPIFTWTLTLSEYALWPMMAHIDHVFVQNWLQVKIEDVIDMPGSDHDALYMLWQK